MSLLDRLKSFLGLEGPSEPGQEQPVAVTVEREAGAASDDGDTTEPDQPDAEVGATADTAEPAAAAVEPDEAGEASETEPAGADEDGEDVAEDAEDTEVAEDTAVDTAPVTEISGIGPAYSERLANADITNVSELADADPADLASRIDVSETRLSGWIEAARERTDTE